MRRTMLLTLAALLIVTLARTQAVTDGKLDGNAHPAVVLLLMEWEAAAFRAMDVLRDRAVDGGHAQKFPAVLSA